MEHPKTQILNDVLNYISANTTYADVIAKFPQYHKEQLRSMIRRFQKDGFVDIVREDLHIVDPNIYMGFVPTWIVRRTFEGDVFIDEEGGYVQRQINLRNQDELRSYQSRLVVRQFWVNVMIAFGTTAAAIYYIHELIRESGMQSACH